MLRCARGDATVTSGRTLSAPLGHTVPVVDYLDVAIIVFLFLFALAGLRRGLSGVAFSLAGLLAGLFLGAVIAAPPASVIAQAAKGRR